MQIFRCRWDSKAYGKIEYIGPWDVVCIEMNLSTTSVAKVMSKMNLASTFAPLFQELHKRTHNWVEHICLLKECVLYSRVKCCLLSANCILRIQEFPNDQHDANHSLNKRPSPNRHRHHQKWQDALAHASVCAALCQP